MKKINPHLNSYLKEKPEIYDSLLNHTCEFIKKDKILTSKANYIDDVFLNTNRNIQTIQSMSRLLNHGRLKNTGYLSILPVDQGIEHSAGASFSTNMDYLDPENIFKLALEAQVSGLASSLGVLSSHARKYAHKIPMILKINHNELLSYPNSYHPSIFSSVERAWEMGCVGVGATIYFGSQESKIEIERIAEIFEKAHDLGMITILWAYLRNNAFLTSAADYHLASDLTGQANHISASLGADIVKQKLPQINNGFAALKFGKYNEKMYSNMLSEHPIDQVRYQVAHCYMGKVGLINSGGASGENDIHDAIQYAIINKRAGGMGLILGRKAFQKSLKEGVEILNLIQDVYLDKNIDIA